MRVSRALLGAFNWVVATNSFINHSGYTRPNVMTALLGLLLLASARGESSPASQVIPSDEGATAPRR